jgi:hypothetical protein
MPGRTPAQAFDEFLDPLKRSVSCLGPAKIVTSAGGRQPGGVRVWSLNGPNGFAVKGCHLEAEMHYEIIRVSTDEWRVTTHAYRYKLSALGQDIFRIHWHPFNRRYKAPHIHANFQVPGSDEPTADKHMPTGRLTFEDAVEWAFNLGVEPYRSDWATILQESKAKHVEHRTWHNTPPST